MIVILDDRGLANWLAASQLLRSENIIWLGQYMKTMTFQSMNFGPGSELAFQCPGCGRWCPHETASVDHIVPRTRLQFEVSHDSFAMPKCISGGGAEKYKLQDSGTVAIVIHNKPLPMVCQYSLYSNFRKIKYKFSPLELVFPGREFNCTVSELLENDLHNLQFMCASCNSKKNSYAIIPHQFSPRFTGANELRVV